MPVFVYAYGATPANSRYAVLGETIPDALVTRYYLCL
jgi:hypothetical protein